MLARSAGRLGSGPDRNDELEEAYDRLEKALPGRPAKIVGWLRGPHSKWVRLPLGVLFIFASFFWFLPVIGIEMLPVGLLLVAQDVRFMRRPVGRMVLWMERRWQMLVRWWTDWANAHRRRDRPDQ